LDIPEIAFKVVQKVCLDGRSGWNDNLTVLENKDMSGYSKNAEPKIKQMVLNLGQISYTPNPIKNEQESKTYERQQEGAQISRRNVPDVSAPSRYSFKVYSE